MPETARVHVFMWVVFAISDAMRVNIVGSTPRHPTPRGLTQATRATTATPAAAAAVTRQRARRASQHVRPSAATTGANSALAK